MTSRRAFLIAQARGRPAFLTVEELCMHLMYLGSTGTGKTTALELLFAQFLMNRLPFLAVDGGNDLADRIIKRYCHLLVLGYPVGKLIVVDFSQPDWVLPLNFLKRGPGELSVQVDDIVRALLAVWGAESSDQTPTRERVLKISLHVALEKSLDFTQVVHLLDFHARELSDHLTSGLDSDLVAREWAELRAHKTAQAWREEVLSSKNWLLRLWSSDILRRSLGQPDNALDFDRLMAEGISVVLKVGPSPYLSREQGQVIANLVITSLLRAAERRPNGANPYPLAIDEAERFPHPDLPDALAMLRKKRVPLIFGFQHLGQYRIKHPELYAAMKNNCRTKLVFATPDRNDATELAGDLVADLAEPEIKYTHKRLAYRIEDIRETAITRTHGHSRSHGRAAHEDTTESQTDSTEITNTSTRTDTRARTRQRGISGGESQGTGSAHQHAHTEGGSSSDEYNLSTSTSTTTGSNEQESRGPDGQTTTSTGRNTASATTTHETHHTVGTDNWSDTDSQTETQNSETSRGWNRLKGTTRTTGSAAGQGQAQGHSIGRSMRRGQSTTEEHGENESLAITDQPGTRHIPFLEKTPEFYSLQDRAWKAAERIMRQPCGQCVVSILGAPAQDARIPQLPQVFLLPRKLLELTQQLFRKYCRPLAQAEQIHQERRASLLAAARAHAEQHSPGSGKGNSRPKRHKKPSAFDDIKREYQDQ